MTAKRQEALGLSKLEQIEAVFRNPDFYALADVVHEPDPAAAGRPLVYPTYMTLGFEVLADVFGSARQAATELAKGGFWQHVQRIVGEEFQDRPEMHLIDKPMTLGCFNRRKKRLLANAEQYRDSFPVLATAEAQRQGLLGVGGANGLSPVPMERVVYGDGKVVSSPTRYAPGTVTVDKRVDPDTGELTAVERYRRACPDAKVHRVGGGKGPTTIEEKSRKGEPSTFKATGVKLAHLSVRGGDVHSRMVLAVDHVADEKGAGNSEAAVLTRNIGVVAALANGGVFGVTTDTVLRGVHIAELSGVRGLLVVNPTAAKAATVDGNGEEHKTKKTRPLRDVVFDYGADGTATVTVYTYGGALARATSNERGERVLEPLPYRRAVRRSNKDGSFRWYAEYEVPCPRGGVPQVILERTVTNDVDRAGGFNRSENVRQVPFHSDQFREIRARCSDAEALNRGVNDRLPEKRARSFGWRGVLVNGLTRALVGNAVARARYEARTAATDQQSAA